MLDIAAGNGRAPGAPMGIAPEADLMFVHLATRVDGVERAKLGNSVTLLEALHWMIGVAAGRPVVINMSMGRCGGPHNGFTNVEQAIDFLLREQPGRCCVHSTGNYYSARMHAAGMLRPGETQSLGWTAEVAEVTPNELDLWYPQPDRFEMRLFDPEGALAADLVLGVDAALGPADNPYGHAYHRADDPSGGGNHVDVFLYPGAPIGRWRIELAAGDVVDGRWHAWIERDADNIGRQPRFDAADAVPTTTTGTICNGFHAIAVGAYDAHDPARPLAPFSSAGPTRDGRSQPALIAPGRNVLAARSRGIVLGDATPPLTRYSGTSMASPHVAGTVALMFERARRKLRIDETRNLLLGATQPWEGGVDDAGRAGSGYLDIAAAVRAAEDGSAAAEAEPAETLDPATGLIVAATLLSRPNQAALPSRGDTDGDAKMIEAEPEMDAEANIEADPEYSRRSRRVTPGPTARGSGDDQPRSPADVGSQTRLGAAMGKLQRDVLQNTAAIDQLTKQVNDVTSRLAQPDTASSAASGLPPPAPAPESEPSEKLDPATGLIVAATLLSQANQPAARPRADMDGDAMTIEAEPELDTETDIEADAEALDPLDVAIAALLLLRPPAPAPEPAEPDLPRRKLIDLNRPDEAADEAAPAQAGGDGGSLDRLLGRDGGLLAALGLDALTAGLGIASPALLFDLHRRGRAGPAAWEPIGKPGEKLAAPLAVGDVLLRRAPGQGSLAHLAVVADPALVPHTALAGRASESPRPGQFVQVVEEWPRQRREADGFHRLVFDADGRVPLDQVILRRPGSVLLLESDAEDTPSIPCKSDLSGFGIARREHDLKGGRQPRPQIVGGKPLCKGELDFVQSGPGGSTLDLLLWNFDIDGSYPKVQHEAALDRLIFELHERIRGAKPRAAAYTLFLTGFTSRTGDVAYNEKLATEREEAVRTYLQANIEKFRKIPETALNPQIVFERNPGGFDPAAPPKLESPHARSVHVVAVPAGKPPPPPRPFPPVAEIEVVLDHDNDTVVDQHAPVATFARFGLWNHAYNPACDLHNGFTAADNRAYDADCKILNGAAEADNFVGQDSRRFYFRVRDPGAGTSRVTARWKTLRADGKDDDAPASRDITLMETSPGSHVYVSKAVMLVTDDTDANQPTHSGLSPPLADARVRRRGESNHRLRRARLDGFVQAEYTPPVGSTVTVQLPVFQRRPTDERRRLKVRVVDYGSYATVPDAIQRMAEIARREADIARQFEHANRRWNQIGLSIDRQPTAKRAVPRAAVNGAGIYIGDRVHFPVQEAAALNDLIPVTPDNTVTAVFVPMKSGNAYATIGERNSPPLLWPLKDRYFIFINVDLDENNETLAHELAHVLFNRFDVETNRRFFTVNTLAPDHYGMPLPDVRLYRRIQDLHTPDPNNDPRNENVINWARRVQTTRTRPLDGVAPADATTGNKLLEPF